MVKINDIYSFNADSRCYTLYEKCEKKEKTNEEDLSDLDKESKKDGYKVVAYYTSIKDLINGIFKREVRKSISKNEVRSLEGVKNKIVEVQEYIKNLKLDV